MTTTPMFESTKSPDEVVVVGADELRRRWLGGTPCRPPCWEGIVPGEASAIEMGNTLDTNALFSKVEVRASPLPGVRTGHVSFEGKMVLEDGAVRPWGGDALFDYTTSEQIIYVIRVGFPETCLGDLIQAYGEPSHVMAYGSPAPDIDGPYTWQLDILWVPQGLTMQTGGFSELRVEEGLGLSSALFFPPTLEGYGKATNPFFLDYVKPWRGYADFDTYFEPTPTPEGEG